MEVQNCKTPRGHQSRHSPIAQPPYFLSSSPAKRCIRWLLHQTKSSASVNLQREFIRAVVTLILNSGSRNEGPVRTPRDGQLDAIWRTVYRQGDTILIAKTGYGKTIVLQAISVITGQVTVQIVPLSRLGSAQVEDIKRIPGTSP